MVVLEGDGGYVDGVEGEEVEETGEESCAGGIEDRVSRDLMTRGLCLAGRATLEVRSSLF